MIKWLFLFVFSCFSFLVHAQAITLNGPWKFKTGDDVKWASPDLDDSAWETVDLTAPPGSHDGDVGLSGYVGGWAAKGHPGYSGYAWYRLKVLSDSLPSAVLALTGPTLVDDGYQLYVDGVLMGSEGGDFSRGVPVAYGVEPHLFVLPLSVAKEKWITIAFRVWMDASTLDQGDDVGGIHIAPVFGSRTGVAFTYNFQWGQTIKGYILEVIIPVLLILLALALFVRKGQSYRWFIIALVLLAFVRFNQAVFYWFEIESAHEFDIVTVVILRPLILGSFVMAWRQWFRLDRLSWMPHAVGVLTLVYMGAQLLALPWLRIASHAVFQVVVDWTRLLFIVLLLVVVFSAARQRGWTVWLDLFAVLLISIGLFPQEVSALHIPGIWFPWGVGVSRAQFAYMGFLAVMVVILIQRGRAVRYY